MSDRRPTSNACSRSRRPWVGAATLASVILMVIPALIGAGDRESDEIAGNRSRIEGMTALERTRLRTRHERFRALGSEEQERLREMHDTISAEPTLQAELIRYRAWLETLTPLQRDELRNETDPDARLRLVRRYREQQRREEERSPRSPFGSIADRAFGERRPPRVDPESIAPVYDLLADRLSDAERRYAREADSKLVEHLRILQASMKNGRRPPGGPGGRPPKWPDSDLLEGIIEVVPADTPASRMLRMSKSEDSQRARVVGMLLGGLWQELAEEKESRQPTEEQLREFFSGLDATEREKLVELPQDEFREELGRRYGMAMFRDVEGFRPVAQFLFGQMRGGRPPFGGPRPGGDRRDGRDGERPRFPPNGGRPGEGRPPFGRDGGRSRGDD